MPPHRVQRTPRTRKEPVHKTSRRELHPIQRAFLCGALLGGASQQSLSRDHGISQATISRTFTRLKARAAELGITDLVISDSRLIKEAPKLFEDQNRRGRKELLTPEQRAMVVAVATRSKEAMKAKSSKFVSMRKLEDGTIERTMDPELEALGLPPMSTSTFEGCMYEAGYVRTKEGWKKVGGAKREKAESNANQQGDHGEHGDEIDGQLQDQLDPGDLNDESMQENGEPYSDHNIHPDLQQESDGMHPDLQSSPLHEMHHDPQLDNHAVLDPGLHSTQTDHINHKLSQHDTLHPVQSPSDQLSSEQLRQEQLRHQQLQEQLRQEHELRQRLQLPQNSAPPYANADAWRRVVEGTSSLPFGA